MAREEFARLCNPGTRAAWRIWRRAPKPQSPQPYILNDPAARTAAWLDEVNLPTKTEKEKCCVILELFLYKDSLSKLTTGTAVGLPDTPKQSSVRATELTCLRN